MDLERHRHRSRNDAEAADAWRELLAPYVTGFTWLDAGQRERLERRAALLVGDLRWEAAQGFAVTDEMQLTIAARAALLIVELDERSYHDVSSVIVHPAAMVRRRERATAVAGVMRDDEEVLLGVAHHKGPVLLAWAAVLDDVTHPGRGHDVVLHEFAHRLDMLDGLVDGTPLLPDAAARHRWVEVCTGEYLDLRRSAGDGLLSGYGGVNPGEFFAVATEAFFTRGPELAADKPELYGVLRDFYRQDPAAAPGRPT